ncbi:hypothetical protein, partial [Streptococcus pneumoniae]|uniref:hypothetical protein n=1 Tax=Streptococcus pneumoniae TaxID=1313 RepID=UPI003081AA02
MFDKEQKRGYKQSAKNLANWHYNDKEDSYTHPDGWYYRFHHTKHQKTQTDFQQEIKVYPNHSYLSQLDVTYKTPDLMSHFLPPHEVSFTFCCSSIVFPR